MDDLLEEPWGLLVTKEGGEDERVPVLGKEFIIGRAKDCNLCITNSKLVSNHHCVLMRDDGGKVLLKDTSSNGTLVNGKLIKKNETLQVNNGDVIHLVSKKNHHEENISYEYHELRPIEGKEEEEEDEATLELTLECDDLDPPPTKKLATEAEIIEGSKDIAEQMKEQRVEL